MLANTRLFLTSALVDLLSHAVTTVQEKKKKKSDTCVSVSGGRAHELRAPGLFQACVSLSLLRRKS